MRDKTHENADAALAVRALERTRDDLLRTAHAKNTTFDGLVARRVQTSTLGVGYERGHRGVFTATASLNFVHDFRPS